MSEKGYRSKTSLTVMHGKTVKEAYKLAFRFCEQAVEDDDAFEAGYWTGIEHALLDIDKLKKETE